MTATAKSTKEEGNKHFSAGDYEKALSAYTRALSLDKGDAPNLNVYRKNRAACYLKLKKYQLAVDDCTIVLDLTPGDPKALFRRCQAYEALESVDLAYKDALLLIKIEPRNTAVLPIIQRLNPIIQMRVQKSHSTDNKVKDMFEITFDTSNDLEKRKQAANNLIVLAREGCGADQIFKADFNLVQLKRLLKDTDSELKLTAMRVLACLAEHNKIRANAVLDGLSLKIICIHMGSNNEELCIAATHLLKNIINSITNIDVYSKEREEFETKRRNDPTSKLRPYPFILDKIDKEGHRHMDYVFPALITMLGHCKVSHYGRDSAMELILKFVTRQDGAGWSKKFIEAEGLQRLLEVAGTVPEHKTLQTSVNTRMHASLCLSKIYDDLTSDKERDLYKESVNLYFNDMFGDQIIESKLEAIMAMSALLQGPIEVGNMILAREGVIEILLAMTEGGDTIHVKYAIEALVNATSKKNRCTGVIKQATPILKKLYQNSKDSIKVRALVGLCKLGSFGGNDASSKTYADGSTQTLSKACRRFLMNPEKDVDIRKWASEGLAYLTLDADVKHDLCNDTDAINSLLDLAKIKDKGILYPVGQILVNCTNSYDKIEVEPELVELARFSKQHVPEEHEKDGEVFIKERIEKLLKTGIVNALVYLSKSESESSREQLSRIYLALVMDESHRGLIVQQGGAKALIPLANDGNFVGKAIAAQALAKISITQDPNIAFPGQRAYEVIRPILQLLAIEKTAIQNFEALMALTNLASMSDSVRLRIIKDNGVPMIEHYLYEEHDELRRAATECFCNLVQSEEIAKMFQGENDRVKLMVLFSGEEDQKLVIAASGCLAILSTEDPICEKIVTSTTQWNTIMQQLLVSDDVSIQHRGMYIIRNMIAVSKELAETVFTDDILKVVMALSKVDSISEPTRKLAKDTLVRAVKWGLIQSTD